MKQFLLFFAIAIFSVFVGSQITEGMLLVPYWQSLSSSEFYSYYDEFGPAISKFYTVLTIIAALIPISLAIYCFRTKSRAFTMALISSFFAILFVATFYIYFKDANELFYQASLSDAELTKELGVWNSWHWARIIIEFISLVFLIFAISRIQNHRVKTSSV